MFVYVDYEESLRLTTTDKLKAMIYGYTIYSNDYLVIWCSKESTSFVWKWVNL